jgi:alkyldihydroxyacetonephosphate synthase
MAGAMRERLIGLVGPTNARDDAEARVRHAGGKSTPDLIRLRAGRADRAPDLVLFPGSHEEVLRLLEICSEGRVAVVPFGGGTSVVGGLTPAAASFAGIVALDLRRMNALLALDEVSRLAEFEPGLRAPEAESLLGQRGYTIGHFPQSYEYATLGGFAAARSSGQASAGYGRFDDLVLGLRVATPVGTLTLGRAPKSAAGPDLRQLVLGSEGSIGVITGLTVSVRPAPEGRVYEGWRFGSFAEGAAMMRSLAQDGPLPTVLRLSDEAETALNLPRPDAVASEASAGGSLAIIGYEGSAADVEFRKSRVTQLLRAAGAQPEDHVGPGWAAERYRGPYLRDSLLEAGALVETLETVTFWSALDQLYAAVSTALRDALTAAGTPPVILCHISHVYPAGASLYFTVAAAQTEDPISQWTTAKSAASDAILSAGGSITHHHGVGTDHRPWYEQEIGALGVGVLQAFKSRLDPQGIMNPGVLVRSD